MSQSTISKIVIYPIKSLPGVTVKNANVLKSGALEWDRRWTLVDQDENTLNAKSRVEFHYFKLSVDEDPLRWQLRYKDQSSISIDLSEGLSHLESWFSDCFGEPVKIRENQQTGFPDDLEANGPTIVSIQSLEQVCVWFEEISLEECIKRFRPNILIESDQPFWEDRLVGKKDQPKPFEMGNMTWNGLKICQRCIVPTRHPESGEMNLKFSKEFKEKRSASLPRWAEKSRFDHYYRLCINTQLIPDSTPLQLNIGDSLKPH